MKEQLRKEKFVKLLEDLLGENDNVKLKLAKKLEIKPSTLTPWLQGKIDPAGLDVLSFRRLAKIKGLSVDEVAFLLGVVREKDQVSLENKFKNLIEELLSDRSQQELADRLGVGLSTVNSWISPHKKIDPRKINISTIAGIAIEKKWSIERLLIYLGLEENQDRVNLLSRIKLEICSLSPIEQSKLKNWFLNSEQFSKVTSANESIQNNKESEISIILEKESLKLKSDYLNNLKFNFQIPADNITIATITQFQEVKEDLDLIIFDIETNSSNIIDRINKISFNSDIIIFTSPELEQEIRQQLEDKVTDIVVKPIDWLELKNKPYFS